MLTTKDNSDIVANSLPNSAKGVIFTSFRLAQCVSPAWARLEKTQR